MSSKRRTGNKSRKNARALITEPLENRLMLTVQPLITTAPQITANTTVVAFNSVSAGSSGAGPSRVETVTITDTGADPLTFGSGAFQIVTKSGFNNVSNFVITNAGSLPTTLASGASATINLQYTATIVGLQEARLQITSNDPVTPMLDIDVNGIGTPGQFGVLEPSLAQVLRAYDIPTIIGAGPNDVNLNTQKYPINPDPSSEEVSMQRMVVANPGQPVTITALASFSSATEPVSRIGYYTPGNPNAKTELFYIGKGDAQVVNPTEFGASSFDPGTAPFSLYGTFPGTSTSNGSVNTHYSEDELNTLDPTHSRKIRFFPMKTANGTVVPNTFVVAMEDYDDPTAFNSFINYVGIISNVMAAPNALAGSTPSSPSGNNPPVMGIQANQLAPGSNTLVFNTIQKVNSIAADVVHNTNTITINNTGDQPLVLSSLTLSDTKNWQIVNPPAPGTSIPGDSSLTITVKFIATTDPPHTTDETNDIHSETLVSVQAAGGVWNGTLTITSNDAINPTRTVNLAGYWQIESEHENEPGIPTITNLLFGYTTNVTGAAANQGEDLPNNGNTPILYGDEVDPSTNQGLLVAADPGSSVSLIAAAGFHQQFITLTATVGTVTFQLVSLSESGNTVTALASGPPGFTVGQQVTIAAGVGSGVGANGYVGTFTITSVPTSTTFTYTNSTSGLAAYSTPATASAVGWYPSGGSIKYLYKDAPSNGQAVFPNLLPDSFSTVQTSFTPTGNFGLFLDGEKSQDASNTVDFTFNNSGHGDRFFPLKDANGNIVPNTWIVGLDYRNYANPNGDYQDLYEILTNATFASLTATPIDLQASEGIGGIELQWAPVSGAKGYNVYQVINGVQVKVNTTLITSTNFLDTTATNGSTVKYHVTAVNASSVESLPASASETVTGPTAPVAPTIQTADGSSGNSVVLTWTSSTGATSYNVQRRGPGEASFTTVATGLATTLFDDTNVVAGSQYTYEVQAVNSVGPSPFSAPMSATVIPPTTIPATPVIQSVDGSTIPGEIVVTWGVANGAATYNVLREDPGQSSFNQIATGLTGTSYADTSLSAGGSYAYEVQAVNTVGPSLSAPMSGNFVGPMVPPAPLGLAATPTAGTIVLTWSPSTGATSYTVEREAAGQTTFFNIATALTATSFTDVNVSPGSQYTYTVLAVNAVGPSQPAVATTASIPTPHTLSINLGKTANSFVRFTTANGALTTLKFTGSGTATVNFSADTPMSQTASGHGVLINGTNISITSITTSGSAANSSLTITAHGGNNLVTVGGITIDGALNALNARTTTLIGNLSSGGSVNRIVLGNTTASAMTIHGNLGVFQTGSATGVGLSALGTIRSIVAAAWTSNQAITAAAIKSINIKSDAQVDVTAGSLSALHVRGNLHDSQITLTTPGVRDLGVFTAGTITNTAVDTTGSIGSVNAVSLTNSQIYAGTGLSDLGAFPPASSSFPSASSIANITLRKAAGVVNDVNSSIAASAIGHASLGLVQFANGGKPFGMESTDINSITFADSTVGKLFHFTKLISAATVTADLAAKSLNTQDFDIDII